MFSSFTAFVKSATSSLPFTIGKPVESFTHPIWKLHDGVNSADKAQVSVFVFDVPSRRTPDDEVRIAAAEHALGKMKTIRHPNTLALLHGISDGYHVYIVTQRVTPLSLVLNDDVGDVLSPRSGAANSERADAVAWGIKQLASSLQFLGESCNLVHGNIRPESIFVTGSGDWRLGGFEMLCSADEAGDCIKKRHFLFEDSCKPPEIVSGSWSDVNSAVDAWGLGCIVFTAFDGSLRSAEQLRSTSAIPQQWTSAYRKLLQPDPGRRVAMVQLLRAPVFKNDTIATNEFLDELAAKNSDERTAFFGGLLEVLPRLPRSCCIHKVLPALETAVEQAAADKVSAHVVLAPALQIGAKLDEEEFKDKILPKLVNWFSSQDQALVAALIENMGTFVGFCDQRTVSEKIWPKLVPAFTNSVPLIREVAVKSIPGLVRGDKLTDRLINHDLIKAFTALLNDRVPAIRVNSLICIGMIGSRFSKQTQQRQLVPAMIQRFTDPFPPCRIKAAAALTAIVKDGYDAVELATKIIPAVAPVTLDTEPAARTAALACITAAVARLEENSLEMQAKAEAEAEAKRQAGWDQEQAKKPQADDANKTAGDQPSSAKVPLKSKPSSDTELLPSAVGENAAASNDDNDESGWDTDEDQHKDNTTGRRAIREAHLPKPARIHSRRGSGNSSQRAGMRLGGSVEKSSSEQSSGDGWDTDEDQHKDNTTGRRAIREAHLPKPARIHSSRGSGNSSQRAGMRLGGSVEKSSSEQSSAKQAERQALKAKLEAQRATRRAASMSSKGSTSAVVSAASSNGWDDERGLSDNMPSPAPVSSRKTKAGMKLGIPKKDGDSQRTLPATKKTAMKLGAKKPVVDDAWGDSW